MTNREALEKGLLQIPTEYEEEYTKKYLQPKTPMQPSHTPRKKVFGPQPPTEVRGTASPMDVQQGEGIRNWVADRPATPKDMPMNAVKGVVGMAAGLPSMVGDPQGMFEAIQGQGLKLLAGVDPEEMAALESEIGVPRLKMYIESGFAPDILSPAEEAKVQGLIDKRGETRAKEVMSNPLETGLFTYGGAKGVMGKPGGSGVSRETPTLSAKSGMEKESLAGGLTPNLRGLFNYGKDTPSAGPIKYPTGLPPAGKQGYIIRDTYGNQQIVREPDVAKRTYESWKIEDPGTTIEPHDFSVVGRQQTISRSATLLDDPKIADKQPVGEWVKTLLSNRFPKDEPALTLVLNKLKSMPIKERLTKAGVQEMLNREAPELETVIAKNPSHPEREGELFVRDPHEYKGMTEAEETSMLYWKEQERRLKIKRDELANERDAIFKKVYDETGGDQQAILMHPDNSRLSEINTELEVARSKWQEAAEKQEVDYPQRRYDKHSWAKQDKLSEPLGRTGFQTRYNLDGSKTLVIDNFQLPEEPSRLDQHGMPKPHQKRAEDLMVQSTLNYAREKGYRDVEWTTGEEQNKRWGVQLYDYDPTKWEKAEIWVWRTAKPMSELRDYHSGRFFGKGYRDLSPTDQEMVNKYIREYKYDVDQKVLVTGVENTTGGNTIRIWKTEGTHPEGKPWTTNNNRDGFFATMEEAKEAVNKNMKNGVNPGDLRPIYDKKIPQMVERHGQGSRIEPQTYEGPPLEWDARSAEDNVFDDNPFWVNHKHNVRIDERVSFGGVREKGQKYYRVKEAGTTLEDYDTLQEAQAAVAQRFGGRLYDELLLDDIKDINQLRRIYDDTINSWDGTDTEMAVARELGFDKGDFDGVMPDFNDLDLEDVVDVINAYRKHRPKIEGGKPRNKITVQGQKPQSLIYSKTPAPIVSPYDRRKRNATQKR